MLIAFLAALMRPLEDLNEDFGAYRNFIDTSVNSQICYMRGMINDYFDYYERRIIVHTAPLNNDYYLLWQDQYNKPNMIYNEEYPETYQPYLLNSDWQIRTNNPDFEIVFPAGWLRIIKE
jgi:hypothetical protein